MSGEIQKKTNHAKVKLMAYHYRAVELRYLGHTYPEIAQKLTEEYRRDFKDGRMRQWFMSKGILHQLYLDYAKGENERRRQAAVEELKKVTQKIPGVFEALLERVARKPLTGEVQTDEQGKPLKKLDMVTVATLKTLVEVLGFKVTDNGEIKDPVDAYFDRAEAEVDDQRADETPPII